MTEPKRKKQKKDNFIITKEENKILNDINQVDLPVFEPDSNIVNDIMPNKNLYTIDHILRDNSNIIKSIYQMYNFVKSLQKSIKEYATTSYISDNHLSKKIEILEKKIKELSNNNKIMEENINKLMKKI
tara:strand:- start:46 stop:432 length:387 start_codon:yes stop_codon:yes gene_type:complete